MQKLRMWVVCGLGFYLGFLFFQKLAAQNLVPNPDFSDIIVCYKQGRRIKPVNWQGLNERLPLFTHQLGQGSGSFPRKPGVGGYGVFFMHIGRINDGIYTALNDDLVEGQIYRIQLRVKTHDVPDLSSASEIVMGEKGDTSYHDRLVANQSVLSFIVRLHQNTPACLLHSNDSVIWVDFPSGINADHPHWVELSTDYKATGKEKYISIGLCFNDDYFQLMRKYKSDTTGKDIWHTRYLLSNVTMKPVILHDERPLQFMVPLDGEHAKPGKVMLPEKFMLQNLNFRFDCYELNEESQNELRLLAIWLIENPGSQLTITGHTDSNGTSSYNQSLSEKRALAVYDFLVLNGVAQKRLSWKGKGDTKPLADNCFIKNHGAHRRVEFTIVKKE